eukprot:9494992-Pyramimonas_sp.AAC.1
MFQPPLALITRQKLEHQESTHTGWFSRAGPWEAILVRHCFDTALCARPYFWDVALQCDRSNINSGGRRREQIMTSGVR